jgi:hypothetical protein
MRHLALGLALATLLLGTGCSGVARLAGTSGAQDNSDGLHLAPAAPSARAPIFRAGQPIRLQALNPTDARPAPNRNTRRLGHIRATVSDLYSSELLLDQSVPVLAGAALRAQLAADGFVLAAPGEAHDYELTSALREFQLNIAGRDELSLVLELSLREAGSTERVWAGVVSEKTDRFAGVMGNSSASIARYLEQGLADWTQKAGSAVRTSLLQAYPKSISASGYAVAVPTAGITTLQATTVREGPPAAPVVAPAPASVVVAAPFATPATAKPPAPASAGPSVLSQMPPGYGYFAVISMPTRVKVYSDDVYYGLTPLKVMVPAGVTTFEFRFDGYKTQREKVSVRAGETTELELKLKK